MVWNQVDQKLNCAFQRTAEKGKKFSSTDSRFFLKHPDNVNFESAASKSEFLCCSSLRMVLEQLSAVRAVASSPFLQLLGLELLRSLLMLIYLQIHLNKNHYLFCSPFWQTPQKIIWYLMSLIHLLSFSLWLVSWQPGSRMVPNDSHLLVFTSWYNSSHKVPGLICVNIAEVIVWFMWIQQK